ncbi:MAG: hypothetical protein R3E91_03285 [Chlamydiales bacterium]
MQKFFRFHLILFLGSISCLLAEEEPQIDVNYEEPLVAAVENLGPNASGFLSERDFGPIGDEFIDPHVLRDFIESKGLIECRNKTGLLTIAADIRARWTAIGEQVNGQKQRGTGTSLAIDRYKSEINLFLDYVAPRTWGSAKVKWVNFDGKDGGSLTRVELDRAFIGYDIRKEEKEDFYIEIGRSRLNYIFDSRLEFISIFDGIHIYYTNAWSALGNFIIHGGPLIVDSFTNHYAWVVETGVIGFRGTGLGFKYSLIDWRRSSPTLDYGNLPNSGKTTVRNNPRYAFLVSQILLGYQQKLDFLRCKTLYIYGAALINHDAKPSLTTNWQKLNQAWYVGFTLGKLCTACDWSIDINYQSVQAQSVPEFDLGGFGHGNAANFLLSDAILQGFGSDRAFGFTNYKGWSCNFLYALSNNLSLSAQGQYATPRNKTLGGDFKYKAFEMTVIYAF